MVRACSGISGIRSRENGMNWRVRSRSDTSRRSGLFGVWGLARWGPNGFPVIFDPGNGVAVCWGTSRVRCSGYSLYKGASFLLGQLGQPIAPTHVTAEDNGRLPGKIGSRPFDGEGLPTRKTMILERGVLSSYLLDTYSGRKLGMASTGNASRSIGDNPDRLSDESVFSSR